MGQKKRERERMQELEDDVETISISRLWPMSRDEAEERLERKVSDEYWKELAELLKAEAESEYYNDKDGDEEDDD